MNKFIILFFLFFSMTTFCQENEEKKKKDSIPILKIHGRLAFIMNQSSFTNWASGGENTIAGNLNVNYDFNFKKNKINWDTRIITSYGGVYRSDRGYRKADDRLEINTVLGYKTSDTWFFSFIGNFRTQYSNGFNFNVEPKRLVSKFFSPAYLTFGPGMLWKKSDDFNFNIAPATARYTLVTDEFSGRYGVEEGRNTAFSLGFNLSGYYKFSLMENVEMENILAIYSDYLSKVGNFDVDYQVNLRFKVNKTIKMLLTLHMIMDDDASSRIQFRQLFGLGLNYSFHDKTIY